MALSRTRKILVSSTVGIGQRGIQVIVTLLTMPMVLHALGRERFGIWGAAASLTWMVHVADFGLSNSLTTVIARLQAEGRQSEARDWIASALSMGCGLALLELAAVWLLVPAITSPATRAPFLIAGSLLALNVPASLAGGIWLSLQKGYATWGWESVQTVLLFLTLLLLIHFGAGTEWYVALSCGVAVVNLASFSHLFYRHPELRPNWRALSRGKHRLQLMRLGLPYFVMAVVACAAGLGDNIIVLARLGADQAGQMAIVQRAFMTAVGLITVASQPLWPAFADAASRGDAHWLRTHLGRGTVVLTLLAVLGSALIVICGSRFIHIWLGGAMDLPQTIFWAMAAAIIVPALGRIPELLLNALGVVWFQVWVGLLNAALTLGLKLILAPRYGINGILLAGAISYGLTILPFYQNWMRRWLSRQPQVSP